MTAAALVSHLIFAGFLALLSAAVVWLMIRFPILDHPNHRSAHTTPTPRGGGVGVVVAFMAGTLVQFHYANAARLADTQFVGVILAAVAMAVVALVDDARDVRFTVKLATQAGAALVAVASGLWLQRVALPFLGPVELGWAGVALTLFWIVGCTNAVNFMDGLDGLVGGTLLISCGVLSVIAASQGGWYVYAAALLLAAGLLGFVPFNLPPARIFMGDVGSQFLGFVVAVLAVAAARFDSSAVSFLIVPLLLFGLLFDAAFTLLRRAAMGERVAAPHRTHLYQMAQRSGMPTVAVAAVYWGFAAFHAALAGLFQHLSPQWKPAVVLPALLVQGLWLLAVRRRMRRAGLSWRC